jgi:hypothetical protein
MQLEMFKLPKPPTKVWKSRCGLCGASGNQDCVGTERKNNTFRFPVCFAKPFNYHNQRKIKEVN